MRETKPKQVLVCPYCDNRVAFSTPEALSAHIRDKNHIRDNYIESLALLAKLARTM